MNITVNNRVTVSRHATDSVQRDPVDQTEEVEFPTRATTKAVDPEGEAAATEEEEEITVGSPLNPNHPTLTTKATNPTRRIYLKKLTPPLLRLVPPERIPNRHVPLKRANKSVPYSQEVTANLRTTASIDMTRLTVKSRRLTIKRDRRRRGRNG